MQKKPVIGFFSFTCCQGCEFTVLFLDDLMKILDKFDVQYFHILKEKNRNVSFDLAFIEGAITTKREIEKLKAIRDKSKFVVALGACACNGGIPAMRNFISNKELGKYVYSQKMLSDSIETAAIDKYIKVDYYMRGCPILKGEFVDFVENFLKKEIPKEFKGPVCQQCPRRGKNCFLMEKKLCLGPITHGGCSAFCPSRSIPCVLCRGPLEKANFAKEMSLFKRFGLDKKDIENKLRRFHSIK